MTKVFEPKITEGPWKWVIPDEMLEVIGNAYSNPELMKGDR